MDDRANSFAVSSAWSFILVVSLLHEWLRDDEVFPRTGSHPQSNRWQIIQDLSPSLPWFLEKKKKKKKKKKKVKLDIYMLFFFIIVLKI